MQSLDVAPLDTHYRNALAYRRTDKREEAQEHLATAVMMYREMGMTYWLEKTPARDFAALGIEPVGMRRYVTEQAQGMGGGPGVMRRGIERTVANALRLVKSIKDETQA